MLVGQNRIKTVALYDKNTDELVFYMNDKDIQFLQDKYKCLVEEYTPPDMTNTVVRLNDVLQDDKGLAFMVTYADNIFFIAHPLNMKNGQFLNKPYRTYLNDKRKRSLADMGLQPFQGI